MHLVNAIFLLSFLALWSGYSFAEHPHKEKEYQAAWCTQGVMEYVLDDKARVDCLTEEYAIEFDFGPKWAEAIGQALYYSIKTERKPGIVLILEKEGDNRYLKRLQVVADKLDLRVWLITPAIFKK